MESTTAEGSNTVNLLVFSLFLGVLVDVLDKRFLSGGGSQSLRVAF